MNINLKYSNNYEIARQIFDNIAIYQSTKNPAQNIESFIGDIEKMLDKVEDKDNYYNKGYNKGYSDGLDDGNHKRD
jgi:hypothetical protein